MKHEKLKIRPLPPSKLAEITVLFNPNSYSITKAVRWSQPAPPNSAEKKGAGTQRKLNAPTLTFGGGDNRQLALELFFDVTEPVLGQRDVRQATSKIVELTRIERVKPKPQPPTCEISWGQAPNDLDFPFIGVISSLTQRFTLFSSDGKPVRATLTVVFTEFLNPDADLRKTDPEFTTRLVKRGDSLSGIAAEVYRDPHVWRLIAEANDLDDPRRLSIGLQLNIPKLS